ncbi:MAG: hypothetical protein ACRD4I_16235 [Candidatus Angelobacter sp.]
MKPVLTMIVVLAISLQLRAQNWATVTASNITDLNQQKLAQGQLCFLGTDQSDTPISFNVGGGGQVLKRSFCANVSNGAVSAFTIPNPALTAPSGVFYRVTVIDSSSGREVLRYTQVTFAGPAFNFDAYAPANLGPMSPLGGTSVTGPLNVAGNINATGSLAAGSVVINGDGMTKAPRMFMAGVVFSTNSIATEAYLGTPDQAITITRVGYAANPPPSGCATFPVIAVLDNTASATLFSLTMSNQSTSLGGPLSVAVPAGHDLFLRVTTAGTGCTTNGSNINFAVQFKMQ